MQNLHDSVPYSQRSRLYLWLKRRRHAMNAWGARYSKIPNDPVLDPSLFPWTGEIANHWEAIRDEALAIYRRVDVIPPLREISPDHRRIISDNAWRSFFLVGYGNEVRQNIARAPQTYAQVQRIPQLNSAFFSILAPGANIVRHRGVSKGFFTAHLGISIPRDRMSCTMQVDDQDLYWRDGEWTIFDDTYEHEVSNATDEPRIILLCQVGRPLRFPANLVARAGTAYIRRSPFVREAEQELAHWDELLSKAEDAELPG